jgi:hypothetical protein
MPLIDTDPQQLMWRSCVVKRSDFLHPDPICYCLRPLIRWLDDCKYLRKLAIGKRKPQ